MGETLLHEVEETLVNEERLLEDTLVNEILLHETEETLVNEVEVLLEESPPLLGSAGTWLVAAVRALWSWEGSIRAVLRQLSDTVPLAYLVGV